MRGGLYCRSNNNNGNDNNIVILIAGTCDVYIIPICVEYDVAVGIIYITTSYTVYAVLDYNIIIITILEQLLLLLLLLQ